MPEGRYAMELRTIVLVTCCGLLPFPPAVAQEMALETGQSCLAAGCHEDMGQMPVVHAPASDGTACTFCHEQADPASHEFTMAAEGGELCSGCHRRVLRNRMKVQHKPVAEGMCDMCHDPHQAEQRYLLVQPVTDLCGNCHRGRAFRGATVHGPVAEGRCTDCHEAHASHHNKLTTAAMPDLCFGCHNRRVIDDEGRPLAATQRAFADESLVKHAPFVDGACNVCHVPHASANHRLLNGPYPPTFYATYAEEEYFCFKCHGAGAFTEPYTDSATGFRNGRLNLHYRHVNRDKGRTCRACHDHHAAPNPKLIREQVPFGNRFITLENVQLTETGGQCGPTCHETVRYDRTDGVENALKVSPRPPDSAGNQ